MDGMRDQKAPSFEQVVNDELMMLDAHAKMEQEIAAQPKVIGVEEIRKATEILEKYKSGKANLEKKIVNDEQFWKMKQWDSRTKKFEDYKPSTANLWACIQSRYSDAMDQAPTCNFLARQEDDKAEAKRLSAIVPVVLEQNRFEETYSDFVWYWLKHGGGVLGVFWNKAKHNGLGDIEIKQVDFLNMFWESGVEDIQDSENVFCVELVNKKALEGRYPETKGHLDSDTVNVKKYIYDDTVDTTEKAVVVDWYYKKYVNGKQTVQYVKFVNDVVLYATENDTEIPKRTQMDEQTGIPLIIPTGEPVAQRGLYDHGQYPFVCQPLFPIEGSLCGYGLIDIASPYQLQIDIIHKAITENTVVNSAPRYFVKEGSGINEDEFLDTNKPLIHVAGQLEDSLIPVQSQQLGGIYLEVEQYLVDQMKYVTSNQDVGNGVAPSGVTAASAIAALQETQGKNARSSNKALYRLYRDMVYQVVELVRQFYDLPRVFRIAPDSVNTTEEQYITYTNEALVPQPQIVGGMNMGMRTPEFDIEVTAEKSSPYKKMEQNELALSFYSQQFFNPQMADQALACLQMMDFQHKEDIMARIRNNGIMAEKLLQYEQLALQMAGQLGDTVLAQQIAMDVNQNNQQLMPHPIEESPYERMNGNSEGAHMTKARNQARETTSAE